jgi:hypothetical protein
MAFEMTVSLLERKFGRDVLRFLGWDEAWPLEVVVSSFVVLGHAAKVTGTTTLGRRGAEPADPAAGIMVLMELRPAPELPPVTARADTAGHPLGIVRG